MIVVLTIVRLPAPCWTITYFAQTAIEALSIIGFMSMSQSARRANLLVWVEASPIRPLLFNGYAKVISYFLVLFLQITETRTGNYRRTSPTAERYRR